MPINYLIARPQNIDPAGAFTAGRIARGEQDRANALMGLRERQQGLAESNAQFTKEQARGAAQSEALKQRLGPLSVAARMGDRRAQTELLGIAGLPPEVADHPEADQLWAAFADTYGVDVELPADVQTALWYNRASPEKRAAFDKTKRSPIAPSVVQTPGLGVAVISRAPGSEGQTVQVSGPEQEAAAEASRAGEVEAEKVTQRARAEREAAAPQAIVGIQQQIDAVDRNLAAIDQALGMVDWTTTGAVGTALKNVAGTPARDLENLLKPVVAGLAFDRLQQMRDMSKTGGALGQVSERELDLLQSAVSSLDQAQSKGAMVAALQRVKTHYENVRRYMRGIAAMHEGAPLVTSPAEARQLPPGTTFVNPEGRILTVPNE